MFVKDATFKKVFTRMRFHVAEFHSGNGALIVIFHGNDTLVFTAR